MKTIYLFVVVLWICLILPTIGFAQKTITVGLVKDASVAEIELFNSQIRVEIENLLKARAQVTFQEATVLWNAQKAKESIQAFIDNPKIDLIVTVGLLSSEVASEFAYYSKPVIAATILEDEFQKLPLQTDGSSGVSNFSYTESWLAIEKDLVAFSKMFDFHELAVVLPELLLDNFKDIHSVFAEGLSKKTVVFIPVEVNDEKLPEIPANVDAVVLFPFIQSTSAENRSFFKTLNERGIPSLTMGGTSYLEEGATLTYTSPSSYQKAARQVAMQVLKVSEGKSLKDIPIGREEVVRVPIINMESVRTINKFPAWSSMANAVLLNVEKIAGEELTFQKAIAIALGNNLQGKISDQDLLMAQKDVQIARANVLPQIEVSGTGVQLSQNLVEASMGQKGEFTITGSATLKQVIWSDAAFGNIAIKKLVAENSKQYSRQTLLDIVSEVSQSYISLLFAKSNFKIKNDNVSATMQNLELAKAKENIGEGGISDVNRWISELNLQKMELNDAEAKYKAAMHQLNQKLNAPINQPIATADVKSTDQLVIIDSELLSSCFENPMLTDKYADFLISRMQTWSPELQQLNTAGLMVDRKKTMHIRQMYIPELALFGGADQAFVRDGTIRNPNLPVPPPPDDIVWNVGLRLSLPISGGGRKRAETKRAVIEQEKLGWQKEELLSMLEQGIRSNVQLLRASYLDLDLSKNAAQAAANNFEVVQDGYSQGVTTLVQLIDAQNAMTKTRLMAENAYYQYLLDYIHTERLQGQFSFLEDEAGQADYINNLMDYLSY
ncbi:MAG TPA: TolC family protein [Marinilabiliaceae bacterium]|nr:TolC family protein [Marinilabiliaceae bacterium]